MKNSLNEISAGWEEESMSNEMYKLEKQRDELYNTLEGLVGFIQEGIENKMTMTPAVWELFVKQFKKANKVLDKYEDEMMV